MNVSSYFNSRAAIKTIGRLTQRYHVSVALETSFAENFNLIPPTMLSERELQIAPIVQESVVHNARVNPHLDNTASCLHTHLT